MHFSQPALFGTRQFQQLTCTDWHVIMMFVTHDSLLLYYMEACIYACLKLNAERKQQGAPSDWSASITFRIKLINFRTQLCLLTTSSPNRIHTRETTPPSATMIHCDCIATAGRTAAKVEVNGVVTPRATPNASQL